MLALPAYFHRAFAGVGVGAVGELAVEVRGQRDIVEHNQLGAAFTCTEERAGRAPSVRNSSFDSPRPILAISSHITISSAEGLSY